MFDNEPTPRVTAENPTAPAETPADLEHPTITFLRALDPSPTARFNVATFTDVPKNSQKPNPDKLARRYADQTLLDVVRLLPKLEHANQRGAGIFGTVNQCKGNRSKANVVKIRGCHADLDGVSAAQLQAIRAILLPTMEVETSSPLRCHCYWLLNPKEALALETAEAINKSLVTLGADKAATDASRLLRLPGFKHMKYRELGRCPIVTATFNGVYYTADDLVTHLLQGSPVSANAPQPSAAIGALSSIPPMPHSGATDIATLIDRIADYTKNKYPLLWNGDWQAKGATTKPGGFGSQSEADLALAGYIASGVVMNETLSEGQQQRLVEDVFSRSRLAEREKWTDRADYRNRTITKALEGALAGKGAAAATTSESCGDIKNGRVFANMWRGKLLYIATRGSWLLWSDDRWKACEKSEEQACAKITCDEMLSAAAEGYKTDPDKGKRQLLEAMAACKLPRIQAMVKLAISEPGMSVTGKELDADPMLIGVENGVVNLKTGQLLPNNPDMLITRFCNARWHHEAQCPRWLRFLDEVFEGDAGTIDTVQRLLGYTLTGLITEEILILCCGFGSNGKSIFSNVVHRTLGGYAKTAPPSLLAARRADDSAPRIDLAAIAGARYVSINEFQAGTRLDEQVVKQLAGREPIAARFLYQDLFEFTPTHTAWLRTNHKPIVLGDDDGIWRRLVVVPFRRKFEGNEKDPLLEEKLLAERDGILKWMLEGTRLYLKDGLQLSAKMKAEQAAYRKESDLLGEFLDEKTTPDPNGKVEQKQCFLDWRFWCDGNGAKHGSKKSFTQRMAERGYSIYESNGKRFYTGLSPLPTSSQCG